ncbi:ABC transporter ATP-binding protein [Cardiobacteriaceae bacterium TAE3-ERU3]|nr:ABC transporter ATP-binding protein [Cardiobacteriaceae bacterium TAE3-ERU3]
MSKILINVADVVVKRRGQAVLNGASIALNRGEVVALVGANGVGKTTLLHVLAGYIHPDSGSVQHGCPLAQVAFLADKPALYPDWSINEVLQRLAVLHGIEVQRVQELIALLGLTSVASRPAKNLSHGYRQRLAMAQMLLGKPQVLLFDEPGNGLDYQQRRALWPLLSNLKRDAGVMLISHDWVEVGAVADRVYLLKDGRCHELAMPQRNQDWRWLEFIDQHAAGTYGAQAVSRDGRFLAVPVGAEFDQAAVLTVSDSYPAQALQEKIDAVA